MFRTLSVILLFLSMSLGLHADLVFRNYRYDTFRVMPVKPGDIVFAGNSITNMHEWWEAFGSDPRVLNRGVSGAVSDELLANLPGIAQGQPAKLFIMIGTNDLGTEGINNAAHVAANVRASLALMKQRSPRTELYVQSILPTHAGIRTVALEKETNDSLRRICSEMGATYIDLWDDMLPIEQGDAYYSLDGLHLQAAAFSLWCHRIAPYVGLSCAYRDPVTNQDAGLSWSTGMRAAIFAALPVKAGDVLFVGDDMVNGVEWNELMRSTQVKRRASGWGYCSAGIDVSNAMLDGILHGLSDNGAPSQLFFYTGTGDLRAKGANLDSVAARYERMMVKARRLAPKAELCILALLPTANATTNRQQVEPFNARLRQIATRVGARYVDTYTPFCTGTVANASYITNDFLYGLGYVRLANLLKPLMKVKVNPLTEQQAAATYAAYGR